MKNLTKNILLVGSIVLAITGCTNNPPLKSSPNVSQVRELRTLSDRNAIALEWDIVNKPNIAGYYIQRSEDAKKYKTIAKIESKYTTHYTDTDLKPNKVYFYKISSYTKKGVPSFAKFKQAKTLDKIEAIPFIANAKLKAKGMIKLIFRPHPNERIEGYYIQRFNDKNTKWENIADLEPRLRAEYIDKGLIDGKVYRYRIIAYSYDGVESYPSKVIVAQTLQKPQMIVNVQATTNLAKKIELNWQPVRGAVEYKIYASVIDGGFELLATTKDTHFIDKIDKDGYVKYYKISSIDKYGIESLKSQSVMGSTLAIPAKPIVSIEKNNNSVTFILSSPDKRAVKYLIKKNDGDKIINIHNIHSPYTDTNIKAKKSYTYKIFAIDKNGLVSKPAEVEVSF